MSTGAEIKLSAILPKKGEGSLAEIEKQISDFTKRISNDYKIKLSIDNEQLKNVNNQINNIKTNIKQNPIKIIDGNEISRQIKLVNNSLEKMKAGKDKVFKDSNVISEVKTLKDMELAYRKGSISLKDFKLQLDNVRTASTKVSANLKNVNKDGYGFIQMLTLGVKKISIWALAATAFYAPVRALQQNIDALKEIDTLLVSVAKVTNYTKEEMNDLAKSAAKVAKEFGRTTQEYLKSVTEFARAGFEKQSEELAKISLLLQNTGDITEDSANEMLLAANAAYQLGGSQENLIRVVDMLNEISNRNPTSVGKMADGIKVAASVFAQAGFSIEEFIALVGTATSATQRSGSETARGLRTVIMNLRQVVDSEAETTEESISRAEEKLNRVGISIRKSATEFKAPMQVLDEIAKKFNDTNNILTDLEKSEIVEALAGKRQANILLSTIQNWSMVQKQLNEALKSTGSALKEQSIYLESWEAKSKAASTAWTEFFVKLVNTDFIKWLIDMNRSIAEFLSSVDGLNIVISLFAGLIGGVITVSIIGLVGSLTTASIAMKKLIADGIALNTLMGGLPLLIGAIITTIGIATNGFGLLNNEIAQNSNLLEVSTKNYKQLNKEAETTRRKIDEQTKSQLGSILVAERMTKELEELINKENKSTLEKEKMKLAVDKLNETIPNLNLAIDNTTGKLNKEVSAVQNAISAYKELLFIKAAEEKARAAATRAYEAQLNIDKINQEKYKPSISDNFYMPGIDTYKSAMIDDYLLDKANRIKQNQKIIEEANVEIEKSFKMSEEYTQKYGKIPTNINDYKYEDEYSPNALSSSNTYYLDKLLNSSRLYKEKLSDLINEQNSLTDAIDKTQTAITETENLENPQEKLRLQQQLIEQLEERKNKYHEIAEEIRNLRNNELLPQFQSLFPEFSGRDFQSIGQTELAQYKQELENQITSLENLKNKASDADQRRYDIQIRGIQQLISQFNDYTSVIEDTYKNESELSKKWFSDNNEKLKLVKDLANAQRDAAISLESEIIQALKDRDSKVKQIEQDRLNRNKERLQEELEDELALIEKKKDAYEEDYKAYKESIEAKYKTEIDALNRQKELLQREYDSDKHEEDQQARKDELVKLQTRYNKVGISDQERFELSLKISELQKEIRDAEKDYTLKSIQNQIDDTIDAKQEEKDKLIQIAEEEREDYLKTLDDREQRTREHYERLIERVDDDLKKLEKSHTDYAREASRIMQASQWEILDFLMDNSSKWAEMGRLQGEAYIEELKAKMDLAKGFVGGINTPSSNTSRPSGGGSYSDYDDGITHSDWMDQQAQKLEDHAEDIAELAERHPDADLGVLLDMYEANQRGGTYHGGGFVGGKPLDPKHEEVAKLLKGELTIPPLQLDNITRNLIPKLSIPKLPQLSGVGGITFDIKLDMGGFKVSNDYDLKHAVDLAVKEVETKIVNITRRFR